MKDLSKAYHQVFRDIVLHGPDMFTGVYDARNGNDAFMYGIQTVMEFIAIRDSEETYEKFSDLFTRNMIRSRANAVKGTKLVKPYRGGHHEDCIQIEQVGSGDASCEGV